MHSSFQTLLTESTRRVGTAWPAAAVQHDRGSASRQVILWISLPDRAESDPLRLNSPLDIPGSSLRGNEKVVFINPSGSFSGVRNGVGIVVLVGAGELLTF
ncbi:hypothetical protein GCM10022211_01250 [Sphingomonas humi]|uniref:Uncharacterized protein n=1 Tax=Sphingomonas humi TaxID=335630 RepID=A0ABP7RE71_9SPHN